MKYLMAAILVLMVAVPSYAAQTADATLTWDANTESDLAGYKVYHGTAMGAYGEPVSVGNVTTYLITGLPEGEHFFSVTAIDTSGNESGFSNEVNKPVAMPPGAPSNLGVTIKINISLSLP